jgi:ribosomal protein L14
LYLNPLYSILGGSTTRAVPFIKKPSFVCLKHKNITFGDNAGININKKVNIMSKYINGPISRALRRKKLITLFKKVI